NAIARNAQLTSRLVPLRKPNGDVKHAVAQTQIEGAWNFAETTVDAYFGENPLDAVRRLELGRDDIEGDGIGATPIISGVRALLHQGTTYHARARVDAPSFLVSKNAIAERLEDEGFSAVSVAKDLSELPADWPQDQRTG